MHTWCPSTAMCRERPARPLALPPLFKTSSSAPSGSRKTGEAAMLASSELPPTCRNCRPVMSPGPSCLQVFEEPVAPQAATSPVQVQPVGHAPSSSHSKDRGNLSWDASLASSLQANLNFPAASRVVVLVLVVAVREVVVAVLAAVVPVLVSVFVLLLLVLVLVAEPVEVAVVSVVVLVVTDAVEVSVAVEVAIAAVVVAAVLVVSASPVELPELLAESLAAWVLVDVGEGVVVVVVVGTVVVVEEVVMTSGMINVLLSTCCEFR